MYPSVTILKWGIRGYSLHEHVFMMTPTLVLVFTLDLSNEEAQKALNAHLKPTNSTIL